MGYLDDTFYRIFREIFPSTEGAKYFIKYFVNPFAVYPVDLILLGTLEIRHLVVSGTDDVFRTISLSQNKSHTMGRWYNSIRFDGRYLPSGHQVFSHQPIGVYNVIRVLFYNVFPESDNTYNAY